MSYAGDGVFRVTPDLSMLKRNIHTEPSFSISPEQTDILHSVYVPDMHSVDFRVNLLWF